MLGEVDSLSKLSMLVLLGDGSRLLTVLDLSGTLLETFPSEVVKLLHLTYLSLRGTNVKIIPKSIGKLQKLDTLNLKNTYVNELPQLLHLLLYHYKEEPTYFSLNNESGFKAPAEIGNLSSLQERCSIEANDDVNESIVLRELGKLTELRILHILKLRRKDGRVLCSSLEKLKNLRSLVVNATEEAEIIDLNSLSLPPHLDFLGTLAPEGHLQKLPDRIPSLNNLVRIYFRWSKLRADVDPLQGLPNLVMLEIYESI
ncbi:hypothetical protein Acr_25g0010110 [Actinidia rufa]|uniref:Disease resistance R13L4/SHOC-2-like LRR domain-containing protein n=1 Tax=Actinidia rufa TaxID=165716 RepID=A0A7J0H0N8_9ERIC|nr:hypothetical protein Acr_25g0010110 [Actinidia rufa]